MNSHLSEEPKPQVAIVDYGMGNLFSVRQACQQAGLNAVFTSSPKALLAADAVILPGVGAFGDAVETLTKLDLVGPLQEITASPKPLIGICLGMQLMMTESHEFGSHRGLGIIEGVVSRLDASIDMSNEGQRIFKVPHVGWNRIYADTPNGNAYVSEAGSTPGDAPQDIHWLSPLLEGLPNGEYMYFVHSFYAKPVDSSVIVSTTQYGGLEFCSILRLGNVFGCQFHPERSGPAGLRIYQNLAKLITAPEAD